MAANHEIFSAHLNKIFGEPSSIHPSKSSDGLPPAFVFVYKNIPEQGMITGVTYGLSLCAYPKWKFGRPEIIVSVNSLDLAWPCSALVFAADFRGKKAFSYGDVFTTDVPLAPDTEMDAFLVFAQSILTSEVQSVQMNGYTINFVQFYPIYGSELEIYNRIGLERFWSHPGFDMYDIKRPPIRE